MRFARKERRFLPKPKKKKKTNPNIHRILDGRVLKPTHQINNTTTRQLNNDLVTRLTHATPRLLYLFRVNSF